MFHSKIFQSLLYTISVNRFRFKTLPRLTGSVSKPSPKRSNPGYRPRQIFCIKNMGNHDNFTLINPIATYPSSIYLTVWCLQGFIHMYRFIRHILSGRLHVDLLYVNYIANRNTCNCYQLCSFIIIQMQIFKLLAYP